MKIRDLRITALAVLVLVCTGMNAYAQGFEYEKERELARAVLVSLQSGDLETFSSYCITEEKLSKMLDKIGSETPMEQGIKGELSEVPASEFRNETIVSFQKTLQQIQDDDFHIQKSIYPELAFYKTRFEVTNLKAIKVKVDISSNKKYMMTINLFKTPDDVFIYDFKLVKNGVY